LTSLAAGPFGGVEGTRRPDPFRHNPEVLPARLLLPDGHPRSGTDPTRPTGADGSPGFLGTVDIMRSQVLAALAEDGPAPDETAGPLGLRDQVALDDDSGPGRSGRAWVAAVAAAAVAVYVMRGREKPSAEGEDPAAAEVRGGRA
jgi:hypothetical protein